MLFLAELDWGQVAPAAVLGAVIVLLVTRKRGGS